MNVELREKMIWSVGNWKSECWKRKPS